MVASLGHWDFVLVAFISGHGGRLAGWQLPLAPPSLQAFCLHRCRQEVTSAGGNWLTVVFGEVGAFSFSSISKTATEPFLLLSCSSPTCGELSLRIFSLRISCSPSSRLQGPWSAPGLGLSWALDVLEAIQSLLGLVYA